MAPQFPQKVRQAEHRWLSPLLPSILSAVTLIVTVAPASLVAAAECQVAEDGGTIQSMTIWKGTTSSTLPRTITEERDIYGGLVPSPILEIAQYMNISRIGLGNTENQKIATVGVCLSQDIRKRARFNQAMIKPIGKIQANAHTKVMKFSALPYNGKRQVLTIRTTPPEIGIAAHYKAPTLIGPVQEIQTPTLSDVRSVSQSVAALTSSVEFPSLSGGQPFVVLNPFQNALQLQDNESLRMNRTTMQALDNRNCVSGCP